MSDTIKAENKAWTRLQSHSHRGRSDSLWPKYSCFLDCGRNWRTLMSVCNSVDVDELWLGRSVLVSMKSHSTDTKQTLLQFSNSVCLAVTIWVCVFNESHFDTLAVNFTLQQVSYISCRKFAAARRLSVCSLLFQLQIRVSLAWNQFLHQLSDSFSFISCTVVVAL